MKILKYLVITYITQATCRRLSEDIPDTVADISKIVRKIRKNLNEEVVEPEQTKQHVRIKYGPEGKPVNKIGF